MKFYNDEIDKSAFESENIMAESKKIIIMITIFSLCCGIAFAAPFLLNLFQSDAIRFIMNCAVYIVMGTFAVIGMKCSEMELKPLFSFKNARQYLWAVAIAVFLSLSFAVIPILCGGSIIGSHVALTPGVVLKNAIFYIVFVGPVEELVFRAYFQELLVDILKKHKWLGVIISSVIFGAWHIINGGLFQMLFTTVIGFIIGFAKYYLKNCTYISAALGHGLYDFSNIIVRAFLVI